MKSIQEFDDGKIGFFPVKIQEFAYLLPEISKNLEVCKKWILQKGKFKKILNFPKSEFWRSENPSFEKFCIKFQM